MSQELNKQDWRPTCSIQALQARAKMYAEIRDFFAKRDVLEVETPLMCARGVTDPYIQAFGVNDKFLQTSPEYAMKRLLSAGVGSIYQICKAFRQEEAGSMHNPEFTMLEWYRVGFNLEQLMDEMDNLLQLIVDCKPAKIVSYTQVFQDMLGINPHRANIDMLQKCAIEHNINLTTQAMVNLTVTDWLQIIMSHVIEPKLTGAAPWIIYDFPAEQAALAKIVQKDDLVAARFEVYIDGIELANGYYELQDATEQERRFAADNEIRCNNNIKFMQADERLVAALASGFPECSGVALGLDRILMHKMQVKSIADVLSFTITNA